MTAHDSNGNALFEHDKVILDDGRLPVQRARVIHVSDNGVVLFEVRKEDRAENDMDGLTEIGADDMWQVTKI